MISIISSIIQILCWSFVVYSTYRSHKEMMRLIDENGSLQINQINKDFYFKQIQFVLKNIDSFTDPKDPPKYIFYLSECGLKASQKVFGSDGE